MPANLLIFDADYISELTGRMNKACELLAGAVSSLRNAGNHDNWKCKERARIIESFDELNKKLQRLDTGVNETTRILGGCISRFASLETQYQAQADHLSDELTENHGFRATVRTPTGGHADGYDPSGAATTSAGVIGAAGAGSLKGGDTPDTKQETSKTTSSGSTMSASAFRINTGNNIFGQRKEADSNTANDRTLSHGADTGGGGLTTNLPVTYIPDNPGAAAKGTKDTREIANEAFTSVVKVISNALGSESAYDGENATRLAETYNAGRIIFESSRAILATPSLPHANERLSMAAGLVTLVHETGKVQETSIYTNEKILVNASRISSALQNDSENSELRRLLVTFTGDQTGDKADSVSSSGDEKLSFFEMIIEELKKIFSEEHGNVSSSGTSSASSSPITKFLENIITEQAG